MLCKAKDCEHEQILLRNMKAHELVLDLLQVPYNKVGVVSKAVWVWLIMWAIPLL